MNIGGVYGRMPAPVQDLACSVYGASRVRQRYRAVFRRYEHELQFTQWWTRPAIQRFQEVALRRILTRAVEEVPFYRELYQSQQIRVADVRDADDLRSLPLVSKQDILAFDGPFPGAAGTSRSWVSTSGTTGSAFSFPVTPSMVEARWAVWWRHRRSYGFCPGTWHLNMTGKPLTGAAGDQIRPFRIARPLKQVVAGMRDITHGSVPALHREVVRRDIEVITGYPSIISEFARFAIDLGLAPLSSVRLVTTGAENLLAGQREALIAAFPSAQITDQYGLSEPCLNLSRYAECDQLHEDFEFGLAELASETGQPCAPGHPGRLVGTGFLSPAFPFIRYLTGDVAVERVKKCSCGRESRTFAGIEGRVDDAVLTTDGRSVMRFDYLFKSTHLVHEAQVVQRERTAVTLRLVPRRRLASDEIAGLEASLRHAVEHYVDPALAVAFEYVDKIPRAEGGKYKAVVSELGRSEVLAPPDAVHTAAPRAISEMTDIGE